MWLNWTMRVSVSTEASRGSVGPEGSWSCSTPSCWSCAPSRRCEEVSSGTWFKNCGFFSLSQQSGCMFHSHRGGWRWQETCATWTCLAELMVLLHQIRFNLAIAVTAESILMQISAEQVSSLQGIVPRYLQLVTFWNLWPFMMLALMLFELLVCILLFSMLTLIPFALALLALSMSLLVRSWSSPFLLPIRSVSSVNCRLHIYGPASNGYGCMVVMECFLCDLL